MLNIHASCVQYGTDETGYVDYVKGDNSTNDDSNINKAAYLINTKLLKPRYKKASQMALFYIFTNATHVAGRNSQKGSQIMQRNFLQQLGFCLK